jgi:hypothetical protein
MKSLSLSSLIQASSYWSRRTVIRWQLLACIAMIWIVSVWLRKEYGQDDSNLWLVMRLFLRVVQWTIVGLFVISLLSVAATWIYFLNGVKNKSISLQAKFGDGHKADAGWVSFTIIVKGPVLRPLLGNIQAQFIFPQKRMSERVILDTNVTKPRHFLREGILGTGKTLLHDRGIYDVEYIFISFCDMFGLVLLPCSIPFTQQLYTLPPPQPEQKVKAQPHSTEEQKHRIDIPKRVEGEHVNYKEFETGDNIYRIVWKIYAKSGDLVVRIPETKDPHASHLYFYASFYDGFNLSGGAFESELLNVYKDHVRNLFEALQRNGYDVRIPRDQELARLSGVGEKKNEIFQITSSSWQNQKPPSDFIQYNKAAFVSLSSLTPASEVQKILKYLPASVPVVVVKLSDAIPSPFKISLKDIFFRPEKQPTDRLRQPWLLSSLRRSLKDNEEEIVGALKTRGNSWLTNHVEFEK